MNSSGMDIGVRIKNLTKNQLIALIRGSDFDAMDIVYKGRSVCFKYLDITEGLTTYVGQWNIEYIETLTIEDLQAVYVNEILPHIKEL